MPINRRVKRRLLLLSVLVVAVVLLLGGAAFFAQWNKERKVQQNYEEGMAAYESGDYVAALPKLSYAVSHRKDDIDLTLAFADTRLRNVDETGQHIKGAVNIYRHILTLDPNNEEAIRALLAIYVGTRSTTDAITLSRRLPENDVEGIRARIAVMSMAGRLDQAIEEVAILREVDPEDSTWSLMEFQLRSRLEQSPESMLALLEEYTAQYPNNQTLAFIKVPLLREARRRDEAIAAARELANLPNINVNILLELHEHLQSLGLQEEAVLVLEQAKTSATTDPDIACALIERSWRRADLVEGREHIETGLENFPDDLRFARYNALFAAVDPRQSDIEPLLNDLLEKSRALDTARAIRDEDLVDALRAYSNTNDSSLRETLDVLRAALVANQDIEILHYLEADLLERSGQSSEALRAFEAIYKRTNSRLAGLRLTDGLLRKQQPADALPFANSLFGRYPTIDNYALRARTWIALKNSGREPSSIDRTITPGSTVTQQIRSAYGRVLNTAPQQATQLLPLLAQAAILDEDQLAFEYALEQTLKNDNVKAAEILSIAKIAESVEQGSSADLLILAEKKGANAFDIEALRLQSQPRSDSSPEDIAELLALAEQLEEGSPQQTAALRRVLILASSTTEQDQVNLELMDELYGKLREDSTTSRIILAYPNIWSVNPALANDALEQLGNLVGEDSQAYVLANARRIVTMGSDDPALRARAIVSLDEVLKKSPGSIEAMLLMSDLLQSGSEPDLPRAVSYLQSALDSRPNQVQLYPRLIELLQEIGERDLALEYLQRYQTVASEDSNAARSRVALFIRQGELDEAINQLQLVLNENDDPLDRIALAQLLVREGREDEAILQYDTILQNDPGSELAAHGKALLVARMGDAEGALKIVDACTSIEKNDRIRARVQIYVSAGELQKAIDELEVLVQIAPADPTTWTLVAAVRKSVGDQEGSRLSLQRALELDPDNIVALTQLTPTLVSDPSTWSQARVLLPQLEKSSPALAKSLSLSMDASNPETGILRPSSEHLEQSLVLIQEFPASPEARRLSWLMHTAARDDEKALEVARDSMAALPTSTSPAQWGYRSAIRAGLWEEALEMAYANRDRQPANARLQSELQIAAFCLYRGRNSEASMILDRFMPVLGDDNAIYELAAKGARESDERLRPAQRLPNQLRVQVLRTLLAQGNVDKAYRVLTQLADQNPNLEEIWLTSTSTMPLENARMALQKVTPRLQTKERGKFQLAQAWVTLAASTEDPDVIVEANKALNNAIASGEEDPRALAILQATLTTASGNMSETLSLLRNNITLYSDEDIAKIEQFDSLSREEKEKVFPILLSYVMTLNNLAYNYTLIEDGDLQKASPLIDDALAVAPQPMAPELLDTKASIQAKQGEYEEAISTITRATQMAPNRADFKLRRAKILMQVNRNAEAMSLAEAVLEDLLDAPQPDLKQVDEAKMLIKELNDGNEAAPRIEEIG